MKHLFVFHWNALEEIFATHPSDKSISYLFLQKQMTSEGVSGSCLLQHSTTKTITSVSCSGVSSDGLPNGFLVLLKFRCALLIA